MRNAHNWLWFATQTGLDDIRDQLEPIAISARDPDEIPWWAIALGVVVVLALIAGPLLWIRKRRRRQVPQTIGDRFEALRENSPPARELYRELHSLLVNEIETRLDVRAKSRTSNELLDAFRRLGIPGDELQEFLAQADLAKFSRESLLTDHSPAIDQCERILQQAASISKLAVIGRTGANRDAAI